MKIYIDQDYRCHTSMSEGLREFDVPFFDDKCRIFIEGYRYVPDGETWVHPGGFSFRGEMIAPAINSEITDKAQEQYEADMAQMSDMQNALNILGVTE